MNAIFSIPRRRYQLVLLLPLLLMACRQPVTLAPSTHSVSSTSSEQTVQVDLVTLEVGKGSPAPLNLHIEGLLTVPCGQLNEVHQEVNGHAITLSLSMAEFQTGDDVCHSSVGVLPFAMNWPLSAVPLTPGEYHVNVNGMVTQFTWPAYAALPQPVQGNTSNSAVRAMNYVLAQQLELAYMGLQLVSAEAHDWPDTCLGAGYVGETCAAVVTPGYTLTFNVGGQTYVFRTDRTALRYRLIEAPEPDIGTTLISYTGPSDEEVGACGQAIIGNLGVAVGDCYGKLIGHYTLLSASPVYRAVLEAAARYTSFKIDTTAGQVKFTGQGSEVASPIQQRQISEWARQLFFEIHANHLTAKLVQTLKLDRIDDATHTCTSVVIQSNGQVMHTDCDGTNAMPAEPLTSAQLDQFYTWMDTFGIFEQASPHRLVFRGRGQQVPNVADQKAIVDFLSAL